MLWCDPIQCRDKKSLCSHPVPCNLHRITMIYLSLSSPIASPIVLHIYHISAHYLGLYLGHLLQSRQMQIWPPGILKVCHAPQKLACHPLIAVKFDKNLCVFIIFSLARWHADTLFSKVLLSDLLRTTFWNSVSSVSACHPFKPPHPLIFIFLFPT